MMHLSMEKMMRHLAPTLLAGGLMLLGARGMAAELKFEKTKISDRTFEASSVFDVNKDGKLDIVSGEYWYEGPDFKKDHKITTIAPAGDYFDDFSDYPMDVNGDGYDDIITGAFFGGPLRWEENPGAKVMDAGTTWTVHTIEQIGPIETTRFWDVDGDGKPEVCPNVGKMIYFKLVTDAQGKGTGQFKKVVAADIGQGHGLGFGDVNGDGRGDFILPGGWVEAPADPNAGGWTMHPEFNLGGASVPILVIDVNGDGKADLIVGNAHDYGLYWMEQQVGADGKRTWVKHDIEKTRSQYHDMMLVDIDNDGKPELVTGKRYRAHGEHDPGSLDPLFISYYKINGGQFERHDIDFGPAGEHSGVGIYFWVADVDGNGWKDIVAPGKDGLFLFKNMGLK